MSESSSDNRYLSSFDFPNMSQGKMLVGHKESKVIEVQNRKKRQSLPKPATESLKKWMVDNKHHPYPEEQIKKDMAVKFKLTVTQVNNWFINNRRRYFKKLFPDHDKNPVFTPKRGAGRCVKRRKPATSCDYNTGSSSDERTLPRKMRRINPVLEDDLSPVESSDSDSSRDKFVQRSASVPLYYNSCLIRYEWNNFILLTDVCQRLLAEMELSRPRLLFY